MKRFFFAFISLSIITAVASCDKVEHPYPTTTTSSTLDWSLYPGGDSATYAQNGFWPAFTANPNTQRNVLIEDFTGHRCSNCPAQTANMEQLIATDPTRIFGVALHTGPTGVGTFQELDATHGYTNVFYNNIAIEIGNYFGGLPGSSFFGNPAFMVNRTLNNGQYTSNAGAPISNKTSLCLASALKVNIQAVANYFPSTRGLFLHVEIDKIDAGITSDLNLVTYLVEDSLVATQLMGDQTDNAAYTHREILRGCLDNQAFGRTLTSSDIVNDNYYVNYSYHLPDQFDAANMHVVIYVMDKVTKEIYQVIKHEIEE